MAYEGLPVKVASMAAAVGLGEVQESPTANTVLARLKDLLTGIILAAGEAIVGKVVGVGVTVDVTKTRTADTNAYAAGDVIATATSGGVSLLTFTNCARANAGSGYVIDALLIDSAGQATKGQFELWLFDTTVADDEDNAVYTPTDAELLTLVGVLQFNTAFVGDATAGAGGNCVYHAERDKLPLRFTCGGAWRNLFGVLVVRNAYTPVSAETFSVRLKIDQD